MAKDKLNPLRTKFEISIEIDGTEYKLVFKPVNKVIQEKLNLGREATRAQYEVIDNKKVELTEIKELKAINDGLLETYGEEYGINPKEKTAILIENKKYVPKISSLTKDIKELEKDVSDVNTSIEAYYKQMFDECISGEDKIKLQNTIENEGFAYSVINVYLNNAARIAQEKK